MALFVRVLAGKLSALPEYVSTLLAMTDQQLEVAPLIFRDFLYVTDQTPPGTIALHDDVVSLMQRGWRGGDWSNARGLERGRGRVLRKEKGSGKASGKGEGKNQDRPSERPPPWRTPVPPVRGPPATRLSVAKSANATADTAGSAPPAPDHLDPKGKGDPPPPPRQSGGSDPGEGSGNLRGTRQLTTRGGHPSASVAPWDNYFAGRQRDQPPIYNQHLRGRQTNRATSQQPPPTQGYLRGTSAKRSNTPRPRYNRFHSVGDEGWEAPPAATPQYWNEGDCPWINGGDYVNNATWGETHYNEEDYLPELHTHEPGPRLLIPNPVEPHITDQYYEVTLVMAVPEGYEGQPDILEVTQEDVRDAERLWDSMEAWENPYYYAYQYPPFTPNLDDPSTWFKGKDKPEDRFAPTTMCFNLHWRHVQRTHSFGLYYCRKLLLPVAFVRQTLENRIDPMIS